MRIDDLKRWLDCQRGRHLWTRYQLAESERVFVLCMFCGEPQEESDE